MAHRMASTTLRNSIENPLAGAFEDAAIVCGGGGIDEFAAQSPQTRERTVLIRSGHPAESDDIGGQDRRKLPRLGHGAPLPPSGIAFIRGKRGRLKKASLRSRPCFRLEPD